MIINEINNIPLEKITYNILKNLDLNLNDKFTNMTTYDLIYFLNNQEDFEIGQKVFLNFQSLKSINYKKYLDNFLRYRHRGLNIQYSILKAIIDLENDLKMKYNHIYFNIYLNYFLKNKH